MRMLDACRINVDTVVQTQPDFVCARNENVRSAGLVRVCHLARGPMHGKRRAPKHLLFPGPKGCPHIYVLDLVGGIMIQPLLRHVTRFSTQKYQIREQRRG